MIFLFSLVLLSHSVSGGKVGYRKLFYRYKSTFQNKEIVPFFVYAPLKFNENNKVRPILFLHGRGFAKSKDFETPMVEHLELDFFFKSQSNENFIIISPQDIFYHNDNKGVGHDYWIGKEGRDWPEFLSSRLGELMHKLENDLDIQIKSGIDTVVGISMGAHGALLLGDKYPEKFQSIVAISPVFRPLKSEIDQADWDVFRPENFGFSIENNIGHQILEEEYDSPKKLQVFISNSDFGLEPNRFAMGAACVGKLQMWFGHEQDIRIFNDNLGHSFKFWKKAFRLIKF